MTIQDTLWTDRERALAAADVKAYIRWRDLQIAAATAPRPELTGYEEYRIYAEDSPEELEYWRREAAYITSGAERRLHPYL